MNRKNGSPLQYVVLGFSIMLALSSCTTTDPAFAAYEAHVETNPNPNAIVGFWQRKLDQRYGMFGEETMKHRDSLLFRSDGTGVMKTTATSDHDNFSTEGPALEITWVYAGGGSWRIGANDALKLRISGGRLLLTMKNNGFASNRIYTRAQ